MEEQKTNSFTVQTKNGKVFEIKYTIHYVIETDNPYNIVFSVNEIIDDHISFKTLLFDVKNVDAEHVSRKKVLNLKDMIKYEIQSHLSENGISIKKLEVYILEN